MLVIVLRGASRGQNNAHTSTASGGSLINEHSDRRKVTKLKGSVFMHVVASFIIVAAMSISISVTPASAHEGATGVVKERMDLMISIGKTMKALSTIVRPGTQFDQKALTDAADQLTQKSERMLTLFPQGSSNPPSEARLEIWTQPAEFKALAKALGKESQELIDISKNGSPEDLMQQFRLIGKTCSDCHKSFRAKKHRH